MLLILLSFSAFPRGAILQLKTQDFLDLLDQSEACEISDLLKCESSMEERKKSRPQISYLNYLGLQG
jgi:hypothetical protein